MIKVEKATVVLTEQTLNELVAAVAKAKAERDRPYVTESMPEGDMSLMGWRAAKEDRGTIFVESHFSKIAFEIQLEITPHTQESVGYKLAK